VSPQDCLAVVVATAFVKGKSARQSGPFQSSNQTQIWSQSNEFCGKLKVYGDQLVPSDLSCGEKIFQQQFQSVLTTATKTSLEMLTFCVLWSVFCQNLKTELEESVTAKILQEISLTARKRSTTISIKKVLVPSFQTQVTTPQYDAWAQVSLKSTMINGVRFMTNVDVLQLLSGNWSALAMLTHSLPTILTFHAMIALWLRWAQNPPF